MASADQLSPPGTSSYSSDTMSVGDGTWDFTKNTFLLPNLRGLNFETMRYNGMGNRFSSVAQYHSMILAHGVLAAITFLFLVPGAVFLTRFYTRRPGTAVRFHAYFQILAVGLTTVVFILGFIAVGPPRNLTNPHHGIGVAIYVLILVQSIGGRLVLKLAGRRSFRLHIHRWLGRATALLGIVQIPLGLTLYGSPKALFILYAVWMGFLLFFYFILDYRDERYRDYDRGRGTSRYDDESSRVTKKSGGMMKWLGPLAAGAGAAALLRGRHKDKDAERGLSRSPSPSNVTRRTREPTVISSRRASDSYYYDDEKSTIPPRRGGGGGGGGGGAHASGGFMNKLLAAGAGLGAGAVFSKIISRRDSNHRDEYSAVSTETPRRSSRRYPARSEFTESEFTEYTEDVRRNPSRRDADSSVMGPSRPPPSRGHTATTPRRSHTGTSRITSTMDGSEYSSYVSPSQMTPVEQRKSSGAGKGFLAGMGLGFLAKLGLGGKNKDEERMREEEDDRRSGRRGSRYTGDGYSTPSRWESRRRRIRRSRPPPSDFTSAVETSVLSEESSIEPRGATPYDPSYARPQTQRTVPTNAPAPPPIPPAGTMPGGSQQPSRYDVADPVKMPPMPPDSDADTYHSPTRHRSRRQDPAAAAAAATASALALAAEEQQERAREHAAAASPGPPVSVRLRIDERDRNITLRKLTEEEAMREQRRRERENSISSLSGNETTPGGGGGSRGTSARRYRRDSVSAASTSVRRGETAADHRVVGDSAQQLPSVTPSHAQLPPSTIPGSGSGGGGGGTESYLGTEPLSPPNPAFARRNASGAGGSKDPAGVTVSSLNSPGGSFSSMPFTDQDAAERRRRRRAERRDASRQGTTMEFS
ncbi:hypothetical protein VTJ49DRAFT_394 [Mycothermus thermophilus]|uniref:Cytochrome b561 domain-containing protein n=1 Tax=Humicola insolens TaxID=85995 RepID=A0ABR3VQ60_HUMIN